MCNNNMTKILTSWHLLIGPEHTETFIDALFFPFQGINIIKISDNKRGEGKQQNAFVSFSFLQFMQKETLEKFWFKQKVFSY